MVLTIWVISEGLDGMMGCSAAKSILGDWSLAPGWWAGELYEGYAGYAG